MAEHARRLCDPDLYRPEECARCGHDRLHVHDRVERRPLGCPELAAVLQVLVFRCVGCRASWRILPRFLARHLWYAWRAVESVVQSPPAAEAIASKPPAATEPIASGPPTEPASQRTVGRWRGRLASCGQRLRALLVVAGGVLGELAVVVEQRCTRVQVLDAFTGVVLPAVGERLSTCVAVIHRLERGVRLM
jgi:hypothetical protein